MRCISQNPMSVLLQSPTSPALISSRCVPAFLRHVRERGGDVEQLRERFGLPVDVERFPTASLSPAALVEFGSACAAASNDPSIGFSAARRAPRGAFGLFEFALRTAPSLREAFARLGRYGRLVAPWARLVVDADRPGFTRVSEQLLGLPHGLGREYDEFSLGLLLAVPRVLLDAAFVPSRAWLSVAKWPEAPSVLRVGAVEVPLEYGAASRGFSFETALLDAVPREADPALGAVLTAQAERELDALPRSDGLLDVLRSLLLATLEHGEPDLEETARSLHMSGRTLQRRLDALGTRFARELEQVRRGLSRQLLADETLPLAEVAFRLGYSDVGTFVRAYRGWTGRTPGAERRRPSTAAVVAASAR